MNEPDSLLCPHSEVSELIEISYPLEQRSICISYISCNLLQASINSWIFFRALSVYYLTRYNISVLNVGH